MPSLTRVVLAYGAALATFLVLDLLWLWTVAIKLFQAQLGPMLKPQPNMIAAAAFYLIFAAGIVALAILPALQQRSSSAALSKGAMLGFVAYATFDLTSLSIFQHWTVGLAVLDMAWGTVAAASAAAAGFAAASRASR